MSASRTCMAIGKKEQEGRQNKGEGRLTRFGVCAREVLVVVLLIRARRGRRRSLLLLPVIEIDPLLAAEVRRCVGVCWMCAHGD